MLDLDSTEPLVVNGTTLAMMRRGEGQPLLFVHGGVSDLRTWSNQFEAFSDRFSTIVYSRRYSRPNARIPDDADDPIDVHVKDLLAVIEQVANGPAHIVGHSWGALIALLAANSAPATVRSLALIEPPTVSMHVSVPPQPLQMLKLFCSAPRLALAIARLGGGALGRAEKAFRRGEDEKAIAHLGRGVLGPQYFKDLPEARYQQVWDNRGPDRAQALHHSFPDLMGETFAEVDMPVLLVGGANSPAVFRLLNDALLERLVNARSYTIENASHIVHEDAPDALNAAIAMFLHEVR